MANLLKQTAEKIQGFYRSSDSTLVGLLAEMRPWQWYKQTLLFLGIFFSGSLLNLGAWTNAFLGALAFSAVAGANYIFNDIMDREEDRKHPDKKHRPIASGQVAVPTATIFAVILLAGGIYIGYRINLLFLAVLLTYLVQNVLYSSLLKHVAFVDIMFIAIGFVLRAVAGVFAIDVQLSPWLIVCVWLAALMFGIGKRLHEMDRTGEETRSVLDIYSRDLLEKMLVKVASTLLVAYSLYTFFGTSIYMMVTLPFAFFAVFRYFYLVERSENGERLELMLLDPPLILDMIIWGLLVSAVIYYPNVQGVVM